MLSNLLTFSHTQQPITTIVYTHGKMGVNEITLLDKLSIKWYDKIDRVAHNGHLNIAQILNFGGYYG